MLDQEQDVTEDGEYVDRQEVDIYTHCLRVGNRYEWHQEDSGGSMARRLPNSID